MIELTTLELLAMQAQVDGGDWAQQCRSNAQSVEAEIERLENAHGDSLGLRDFDYDGFWAHARQIIELFKSLKPIAGPDRERLWAKYSSACAEAKRAQQRERESRQADSRQKRDLVMSKIKEAYFQAKGAHSAAEFAQADALLREALDWLKNGWEGFDIVTRLLSLSSGRMLREDREECWAAWKEAKALLQLRRDEFFSELRAHLGARVERWRDFVANNEGLIEIIEAEIDRCQELEQNARTEEFADRMRERIEEKTRKIADLQARNEEIENRIAS